MNWIATGALLMTAGVGAGAFGAHALKSRLDAYALDIFHTAVLYHFVHAIGILLVAAFMQSGALSSTGGNRVAWLLLLGIVIFSGSLYALALSGIRMLGAVTPIGGVAFLAGWLLLAYEVTRSRTGAV